MIMPNELAITQNFLATLTRAERLITTVQSILIFTSEDAQIAKLWNSVLKRNQVLQ